MTDYPRIIRRSSYKVRWKALIRICTVGWILLLIRCRSWIDRKMGLVAGREGGGRLEFVCYVGVLAGKGGLDVSVNISANDRQ